MFIPTWKCWVVFCCLQVVGTRLLVRCQGMPCPLLPRSHPSLSCTISRPGIPNSHPTCEQEQMPSHLSRPMLQIMPAMPVVFPLFAPSPSLTLSPLSLNLLPLLLFFLFSSFVLTKQISCSLRHCQILYVGTWFHSTAVVCVCAFACFWHTVFGSMSMYIIRL